MSLNNLSIDKKKIQARPVPKYLQELSKSTVTVKLIPLNKIYHMGNPDISPERVQGEEFKRVRQFRDPCYVDKNSKVLYESLSLGWDYDQDPLISVDHPNLSDSAIIGCGANRIKQISNLIDAGMWYEHALIPVWVIDPIDELAYDKIGTYERAIGESLMTPADAIKMAREALASGYLEKTEAEVVKYLGEIRKGKHKVTYVRWAKRVLFDVTKQQTGWRTWIEDTKACHAKKGGNLSVNSNIHLLNAANIRHQFTSGITSGNLHMNQGNIDFAKGLGAAYKIICDHMDNTGDFTLKMYLTSFVPKPLTNPQEFYDQRKLISLNYEIHIAAFIRRLSLLDVGLYGVTLEEAIRRRTESFPIVFHGFIPQVVETAVTGTRSPKGKKYFVDAMGNKLDTSF